MSSRCAWTSGSHGSDPGQQHEGVPVGHLVIVARSAVLPLPHVAAMNTVVQLVGEEPYAVVGDRPGARTAEQTSEREAEDHTTRPDQVPELSPTEAFRHRPGRSSPRPDRHRPARRSEIAGRPVPRASKGGISAPATTGPARSLRDPPGARVAYQSSLRHQLLMHTTSTILCPFGPVRQGSVANARPVPEARRTGE